MRDILNLLRRSDSGIFAIICIIQASLQYITWTFQGTRILLASPNVLYLSLTLALLLSIAWIGFCLVGPRLIAAWNSKARVFQFAIFLQVASFWSVFIPRPLYSFSVFAVLNGLALGIFWATRHGYELGRIENSSGARDTINSLISNIHQLNLIALPIAIGGLYYVSKRLGFPDPFAPVVLLMTLGLIPALYLCNKLRGHAGTRAPSLRTMFDMFSVFKSKNSWHWIFYWVLDSVQWGLKCLAIGLAGAAVAKNLATLGATEGGGALLSWFILTTLLPFSKPQYRHYLFYIGGTGLALAWGSFSFIPSVLALLFLAFAKSLFQPLMDVGNHLYSQQTIEEMMQRWRQTTTRPPIDQETLIMQSLIIRESVLWVFRCSTLLIFGAICYRLTLSQSILTVFIPLSIFTFILPFAAHRLLHKTPNGTVAPKV